jgi:putative ABC transport system substrate-binding protein
MTKKIILLALCSMLLAPCFAVKAQQTEKVPRIGYLSLTGSVISIEAFRQGLRDLGYIEGKNILVEYRHAGGNSEHYPSLVTELVQLKVDAILVIALSAIRAAKQATKTIPIVMITTTDPVAAGLIESLARPGGNITGLTLLARELSGKRLELLKEVIPTVSRVGFLSRADSPPMGIRFKEYEAEARALKIQLQ